MQRPLSHKLRVRYAECDVQGVVFNSHYLAYFDTSITELWRAAVGGYQAMLDRGLDIVVAEARLRFLGSARFDQELTLEISVTNLGNTVNQLDAIAFAPAIGPIVPLPSAFWMGLTTLTGLLAWQTATRRKAATITSPIS